MFLSRVVQPFGVRAWLLLLLASLHFASAQAQCPTISFAPPAPICQGQSATFTNTSSGINNMSWDFCTGDVTATPTAAFLTPSFTTGGVDNYFGYTQVFDGTNWYGFATPFGNGQVQRFDFGPNLENTAPTVNLIGNPSNLLSTATDLKILRDGANWYGLVANYGAGSLVRLDFGSSLTNTPTATKILDLVGIVSIEYTKDGSDYFLLASVLEANQVAIIRLQGGVTGTASVNLFSNANLFRPNYSFLRRENGCGNWFAFIVGVSGLLRMNIGASLNSPTPTFTNFGNPNGVLATPVNGDVVFDSGKWYMLLTNRSFNSSPNFVTRLTIGNVLSSSAISGTSLGDFGLGGTLYAFKGAFVNGKYILTGLSGDAPTGNNFLRVSFARSCSAMPTLFAGTNPPSVQFSQAGSPYIRLQGFDSSFTPVSYTDTLLVNANPVPKIGLSGLYGCQNIPTQFIDSTTGAVTSRSWNFGFAGGTSTQANPTFTYPNRGTFTVTLTAFNPSGCSDVTQRNVVIANRPTAAFTASTACAARSVQFTNTSTIAAGTASYLWRFGNGVTSNQTNPFYTYPAAGTYTATLICISDSGCVDSTTRTVQIPSLAISTGSTCPGSPINFRALANYPGATVNNYLWTFQGPGINSTSSQANPTITFNNLGDYTAKLRVSTSNGCIDSVVRTIQIRVIPPLGLTRLDSACVGNAIRFSPNINTPGNPVVFTRWDFGDLTTVADTSLAATGSYLYSLAGNYTVTLQVRLQSGCVLTTTRSIQVRALPTANLALPSLLCTNTPLVLDPGTSTAAPGDPLTAYFWELPGGFTSTLRNPLFNVTQTGTGSVALTVISAAGCRNRRAFGFTAQPRPVASFSVPADVGPVPFTVTATNGSTGATQYRWIGTNGQSFTTLSATFTFTRAATDTIMLISTSTAGCSDTVRRAIRTFVPVLDLQVLDVARDDATHGNQVRLRFTVQNNSNVPLTTFTARAEVAGASLIEENFTTNLVPGANIDFLFRGAVVIPIGASPNFVCVRAGNPNGVQDATPANNQRCTNFASDFSIVRFYPNPVSDILGVDLALPAPGGINLQVVDNSGRMISQQVISGTQGLNVIQIPVASLGGGVYRLLIQYGGTRRYINFVRN
jgi:PKD repeat protein